MKSTPLEEERFLVLACLDEFGKFHQNCLKRSEKYKMNYNLVSKLQSSLSIRNKAFIYIHYKINYLFVNFANCTERVEIILLLLLLLLCINNCKKTF